MLQSQHDPEQPIDFGLQLCPEAAESSDNDRPFYRGQFVHPQDGLDAQTCQGELRMREIDCMISRSEATTHNA